jgi:hypothetical protein
LQEETMKVLSKTAAALLDAVTANLDIGHSRKIDNASGTYMALHVDRIGPKTYSLAHYYQQNGDLVCDPDGVFVTTPRGWLPVALQLCTGHYTRALELGDDDQPMGVRPRAMAELMEFAAMWLKNAGSQQGGLAKIRDSITRNTVEG